MLLEVNALTSHDITVPSRPHSGTPATYIIMTFDHQHFKESCIRLQCDCNKLYRD